MRGNVLASRNRNEEAQAAWQKAADLKMATPIVYRNLACLEIRDGRKEPALELYEKAWSLGRGDLNLFGEFDRLLASAGRHEHRLEVYEQLPSEAKARSMVANRHVIQLLDVERYEEAMQELMTREFFRAEHEYGTRYYYVEAVVGLALKDLAAKQYEKAVATLRRGLEYPRNINIGRNGIWPNESMAQYLMGACRDAMGQKAEAREHYLLAAHEPHWEYHIMESYEMLAWMALDQRFRAVTLAHKLEEGYRKHLASWWGAAHIVNFGLAQAVKGHIDVARAKWKQGLADAPDGRYLRLHLAMPEWVLTMMGRKS
jgi:tetratricopeptide (TPR) repeat protein